MSGNELIGAGCAIRVVDGVVPGLRRGWRHGWAGLDDRSLRFIPLPLGSWLFRRTPLVIDLVVVEEPSRRLGFRESFPMLGPGMLVRNLRDSSGNVMQIAAWDLADQRIFGGRPATGGV